MSVVAGALGSLGPKLLQLLHGEYKVQKGVKKQVEWLSGELESVDAFLRKVEGVPWDRLDEQVKLWARQVREASYDMEDILDTFFVRVDCGEPTDPSRLKRAMKKLGKVFSKAKGRRDIAGAIDDLKKHLEEVAKRRQSYKLDDIMSKPTTSTSSIDPRLTAMYKEVKHLIGVDKSSDDLISMILPSQPDDDESDKKITKKVSIFGVGGLGKTTLAKVVYDKFKSQYDCGAFVSVGRELDLEKVFKDILFYLDKGKYHNIHNTGMGVDLLIHEVQEFLKNKRYFVVVDDVWKVDTWQAINLALVDNNYGSRVITTTRILDVAKEADKVYKLQPLSYDNSKKLFYTRIFGVDENYLDNQPDDVSKKFLKKCDGIPLAIITMTSLLVDKPKDQWYEVYNSIGFGHKDNRDVENTLMILSFSYYDLPSHLRTCLLYLSTYPEDYLIDKLTLIRKWIAEGFVHGKPGTSLFELGESYFNDLINRSMIQAARNDYDGTILQCRVHDMVLELMRKLSFEENFMALLLDDNVEGTSSSTNVRRLAHQNRTAKHIVSEAKVTEMPKVRTYTAFRCHINNFVHVSSFKLLRVLDIDLCSFQEGCHLDHLVNLIHLRYLRLQKLDVHGYFPELPKQIGHLRLLQTLDLFVYRDRPAGRIILPASIIQLTQLVHLRASGTVIHVPDGIGKLTSLEHLKINDDMPKSFMKELGNLRELRVLLFYAHGIDESMQRDFVESLYKLQKLQDIKVLGIRVNADTAMWEAAGFVLPRPLRCWKWHMCTFSKLPSCINPTSLPNLSCLELTVNSMDEQDLRLLARLPALCVLELSTESTGVTVRNISASDGCFQKLRVFRINKLVQFWQPNEEDSSVSMHLLDGGEAMPFGCRKSDCGKLVPPSAVMPNLGVLGFRSVVLSKKKKNGDSGNFGLEYLPSLREVTGGLNCCRVSAAEGGAVLAALRNECEVHPNHPALHMYIRVNHKRDGEKIRGASSTEEGKKQQQEAGEASQTADVDMASN